MFQLFKSHLSDPEKLRDEELEPTFIDLKNKILSVDYYKQKDKYNHLDTRLSKVLSRIFTRHERYTVEVEANFDDWSIRTLFQERRGVSWESRIYEPRFDISLTSTASELLLYLSFFAYIGGIVKNVGVVANSPDHALRIVNYLIHEQDYAQAIFLKGLMLKYGLRNDAKPNLSEAQILLKDAADKGIGGAIIELRQFELHFQNGNYT